ncbi:hypothetical protein C4556_00485 [Candidatus Parcubacteria bacterium]|nr:MAG: hypothetical protein C4556_00485 [Candidatus Parcubacteria bacterium]
MAAADAAAAQARHHAEGLAKGDLLTGNPALKGSELPLGEYYGPYKPNREWTATYVTRDEIYPEGRDFY